jgi:hypothetical protein
MELETFYIRRISGGLMRLNNAEANLETDSELVATEQEQERERAKKNAINVKNSTVSKNRR